MNFFSYFLSAFYLCYNATSSFYALVLYTSVFFYRYFTFSVSWNPSILMFSIVFSVLFIPWYLVQNLAFSFVLSFFIFPLQHIRHSCLNHFFIPRSFNIVFIYHFSFFFLLLPRLSVSVYLIIISFIFHHPHLFLTFSSLFLSFFFLTKFI